MCLSTGIYCNSLFSVSVQRLEESKDAIMRHPFHHLYPTLQLFIAHRLDRNAAAAFLTVDFHYTMTAIYPGSTTIHCYAYLAHPRFDLSSLLSFVVDGAVPATPFGQQNRFLTCSFRFHDSKKNGFHQPGVYLIEAVVRFSGPAFPIEADRYIRLQNSFLTYTPPQHIYLTPNSL